MTGLVFAENLGQHLHYIRSAQQSNLNNLRLKVVYDSFHLLAHHRSRQVVKLLNTQRVLYGDRGNSRRSPSTQLMNKLDVGLDARAASAIRSCNCQYRRVHPLLSLKRLQKYEKKRKSSNDVPLLIKENANFDKQTMESKLIPRQDMRSECGG